METRDELEQYRLKVVAELERRELRVQELANEVENARVAVEVATRARVSWSADTARNQIEAAHRARLRQTLKELEDESVQAKADLTRAEERLREVDERISEASGESE